MNENTNLTPRKIVEYLDQYIIGQSDAKRSVAVALRNRWRASRLTPEMAKEVSPKNILLIGRPVSARQRSPAASRPSPAPPSSRSKRPSTPKSATSAATSSP